MLSSTEQSVRLDLVHPVTLQIYRNERAKRLRTATKLSWPAFWREALPWIAWTHKGGRRLSMRRRTAT